MPFIIFHGMSWSATCVLITNVAECPIPTYTDPLGVTHCYFMLDPDAKVNYGDGKTVCERMDGSATLAVVDSQGVLDHMKAVGIIDQLGLVSYLYQIVAVSSISSWRHYHIPHHHTKRLL